MVAAVLLGATSAAPQVPSELAALLDRSLFDSYLDRAAAASTQTAFVRAAEQGLEGVIHGWEAAALELAGAGTAITPTQIAGFRSTLHGELRQALEQRLADWLIEDFLQRRAATELVPLYQAVADANAQFVFETDDAGRVRRYSHGNPRLREGASLDADLGAWQRFVDSRVAAIDNDWWRAATPPAALEGKTLGRFLEESLERMLELGSSTGASWVEWARSLPAISDTNAEQLERAIAEPGFRPVEPEMWQ